MTESTATRTDGLNDYLAANRPIGWNDMGSSERDLCEERMTREFDSILATVRVGKFAPARVTTFPASDIPVGARISYAVDSDHFAVATVRETSSNGSYFDVFDKYTGYHEIPAKDVLQVLMSRSTGAPASAAIDYTSEWVEVTK